MENKKKIIWASQHQPLPSQIDVLKKHFGNIEFIKLPDVPNAEYVIDLARDENIKVIATVLPMSMVQRMLEISKGMNIDIIRPEMELLHLCNPFECKEYNKDTDVALSARGEKRLRHMRFRLFTKIHELRFVKTPLGVDADVFSLDVLLFQKLQQRKKDRVVVDTISAVNNVLRKHNVRGRVIL